MQILRSNCIIIMLASRDREILRYMETKIGNALNKGFSRIIVLLANFLLFYFFLSPSLLNAMVSRAATDIDLRKYSAL